MNIKSPRKKVNRFRNPRFMGALAIITLLILGSLFTLENKGVINLYDSNESTKATDTAQASDNWINYEPPTEQEKQTGNTQKEQIRDEDSLQPTDGNATVIVTDAAQYDEVIEVRAFIQNHYQDGTCTITFTKDSSTISKETPAYKDASTTICTNPLFERSEFPNAGEWQLTVHYSAPGASGTSKAQIITIN